MHFDIFSKREMADWNSREFYLGTLKLDAYLVVSVTVHLDKRFNFSDFNIFFQVDSDWLE